MYVSVIYHNDKIKAYSGRGYTYKTELPLVSGDKVLVPVGTSEEKRAMVLDVDLPESSINPEWADKIKEIVKCDEEGKQNG